MILTRLIIITMLGSIIFHEKTSPQIYVGIGSIWKHGYSEQNIVQLAVGDSMSIYMKHL